MTRPIIPLFSLLVIAVLASSGGCLGERYEKNVPAANLELWDGQMNEQSDAGRPRFVGQGSQQSRGLPDRGTGTLNRGTLNRGTMNRGTLRRGTLNTNRGPDRGTLNRSLNRGTRNR